MYRSPNSDQVNNEELHQLINTVSASKNSSHLLILGEFNSRKQTGIDGHLKEISRENVLLSYWEIIIYTNMLLILHRHSIGNEANILDLILSNEEEMVTEIKYKSPLGNSPTSLETAIIY